VTWQDVYERLGLEDPARFRLAAMRRNLSQECVAALGAAGATDQVHRGTGRTTAVLVQAVAFVSAERHAVAWLRSERGRAHELSLVKAARRWCRRLRVAGDRVQPFTDRPPAPGRGDRVFVDHGGP
jgi:hypothetical protein